MDGFVGYYQIQIQYPDQYKMIFTTLSGTFSYCVMPFGLKNAGATFQHAMSYTFHYLTHIYFTYLDDLTACSKKHHDHLHDLHIIFELCRMFDICLNHLKCVFCMPASYLLGSVVSKRGIQVNPLKFHAIIELPPPHTR